MATGSSEKRLAGEVEVTVLALQGKEYFTDDGYFKKVGIKDRVTVSAADYYGGMIPIFDGDFDESIAYLYKLQEKLNKQIAILIREKLEIEEKRKEM